MLTNNIRAWLALAFSAALFFALPSLAVSNEHKGAPERIVDGTLEIVHIDEIDQAQSRFVYYLLTDGSDGPGKSGEALELRFERTPPASLKTGDRLNVRGRAVGRNLWVEDIAAAVPLGTDPNSATGPQILKVSKPDTGEVYYLSYRRAVGIDAGIPGSFADRLNIHHASENGIWSYFIKALSDGQFFDDPTNGLSIVQNSHNTNGVNITISYDSCLTTNPSVSVAPTPQTVDLLAPPASMAYNVTISNNDSLGCDPASFQLTTDLGTLANSTGLVSPGTSSSQLQLTIADTEIIGLNDGDNIFTVDVDRGANSGAGAGNLIGDGQPPTEPSSPAAVKKKVKGQQSVQVSWGASTDAGTGLSFYRIRRGIAGANFVEMATTSSLKYVDTSASVDSSYDYTIEAYDAYNHASTAAQVTYTPGGGGGGRPGNGGGGGGGGGNGNGKGKNK